MKRKKTLCIHFKNLTYTVNYSMNIISNSQIDTKTNTTDQIKVPINTVLTPINHKPLVSNNFIQVLLCLLLLFLVFLPAVILVGSYINPHGGFSFPVKQITIGGIFGWEITLIMIISGLIVTNLFKLPEIITDFSSISSPLLVIFPMIILMTIILLAIYLIKKEPRTIFIPLLIFNIIISVIMLLFVSTLPRL